MRMTEPCEVSGAGPAGDLIFNATKFVGKGGQRSE